MEQLSNDEVKAILKGIKEKWGVTWKEMSKIIGIPSSSLMVYASDGEFTPPIPPHVADIILQAQNMSPKLDKGLSGSVAMIIRQGVVYVVPLPNVGFCQFCGQPFIPLGYGQKYCTGKRGDCGLAARRRREGEKKDGCKKRS